MEASNLSTQLTEIQASVHRPRNAVASSGLTSPFIVWIPYGIGFDEPHRKRDPVWHPEMPCARVTCRVLPCVVQYRPRYC